MRTCNRCGETKPLADYYRQASCRGGYRPDCKECVRKRRREHRANNLNEHRERDRKRYQASPGRQAAQKRTSRMHYRDNAEAKKEYQRDYYRKNPEVYQRSRAKRNARKRGVEHQPYTRREIYDRDGGSCRDCGKSLPYGPGGFHIDHIVPLSLGGPDTPANVQLMCPVCNREKWANLDGQVHLPV